MMDLTLSEIPYENGVLKSLFIYFSSLNTDYNYNDMGMALLTSCSQYCSLRFQSQEILKSTWK